MSISLRDTFTANTVAFIALLALPATALADSPREVLERMERATSAGKDLRSEIAFTIANAHGESVRWTGQYFRKGTAQRWVFQSPLDIRGVELTAKRLSTEADAIRVYLPSIRRLRTIRTNISGEPFLNTDFHYDHLGFEELEKQQHEMLGSETIGDRKCQKVLSRPTAMPWYSKILRWIDAENGLPLRTEYFHAGGELSKVRTIDRVETIGGYPTPVSITMRTEGSGTWTRIHFDEMRYDTELADALVLGPFAQP